MRPVLPYSLTPDPPPLDRGAVHVWRAHIDTAARSEPCLLAALVPEERQRALRFHFREDRDRYVTCRGLLRRMIHLYTGIAPGQVSFRVGPYGKPFLANDTRRGIQFSVAHSGGLALLAFAQREIGVDLEFVRSDLDCREVAQSCFSAEERDDIFSLPALEQKPAFFEYWTCKEACVKADGRGLSLPLESFRIARGRRGWAQAISGPVAAIAPWTIRLLRVGDEYRAAVAAIGWDWTVQPFEIPRMDAEMDCFPEARGYHYSS